MDVTKFNIYVAVEKFPELIPNVIPIDNHIHVEKSGSNVKDILNYSKLLRKRRINIFHSWDYKSTSKEVLACKLAGIKYLYTKKNNAWSKRWWLKSLLSNHIAYDNPAMQTRFFSSFVFKRKITFIPHGVNLDIFRPKKNLPKDQYNLCCIGNIVENKNQKQIIEALPQLPDNVHLNLYGKEDKDYRTVLDDFVTKNKVKNRVHFNGFIDNKDIPEVLSQQHIFILASKQEGLPVSILEAMACGVPVLSSNSGGGAKYILDNASGGYIFESLEELVAKLKYLINNPDIREDLSQKALENVAQRFSIQSEVNGYKRLYYRLLKRL